MKITNIYKKTAALFFLMAAALWPVAEAWGQVKGDKYVKEIRVSNFTVRLVGKGADGSNINAAFDGNYDGDGSWWEAKTAGEKTIVISFNAPTYIHSIDLMGGGGGSTDVDRNMRPESVTVEGTTADNEDVSQTFSLNREERFATLVLDEDKRKQYKALRLTLTPANDQGQYHSLVMNEITLRSDENTAIPSVVITYEPNVIDASITHKEAKWHKLREGGYTNESTGDTFSEKEEMFDLKDNPLIVASNLDPIQATHTMIDTIYMHKGTSITLTLPDYLNSNFSIKSYQRWYSFRTGKTFETRYHEDNPEKVWDLLTPTDLGDDVYRLKNGYVGNPLKAGNPAYKMDFYFPTDEEFGLWFKTSIDGNTPGRDNNWYVVACDVSTYKDFSESNEGGLVEPTLSHRILYYICAVENDNNWYPKALKQQSSSSDTYLEEYEITMPATRIPNRTNELVALSKDARSYVLPDVTKNSGSLTVTIEENTNTAGIFLTSCGLSPPSLPAGREQVPNQG